MSGTPSGLSGRFAELQRRRVFRVATLYAAVAWLVIQVAAITFSILELPGWATKLVLLLVLLGFPVALATWFTA